MRGAVRFDGGAASPSPGGCVPHTRYVHEVAPPSDRPVPRDRRDSDRFAIAKRWATHPRSPDLIVALLSFVAIVALLYRGRALTFFGDEWEFITKRQDLTLASLLGPHNEHWSLFPVLVYKGLLAVFGLHSYLPYLAVLLLVHVTAVAGLFVLLRRIAGPLVALGGATLMLFLGKAYEDLFWAFQIGFVGSVAAGLWAFVAAQGSIDRRALAATGGLLFVAVASSGLGLFFLVAVGTLALVDPSRRRVLVPVAAVGLAYLAWFLVFGRAGLDSAHSPFSSGAVAGIPAFVISGGGHGIGGLIGVDLPQEAALFVLFVVAIVWATIRGHGVPYIPVAAVAGLAAQFVLIGIARDQIAALGPDAAAAPRYVYSSVAFLLIALAALIGKRSIRSISWRQGLAVALLVGFALIGNLTSLESGSLFFQKQADELRAAIAWLGQHPGSPLIRANIPPTKFTPAGVSDILALPSPLGSVTQDSLLGIVRPVRPETTDLVLVGMARAAFLVRPAGQLEAGSTPPTMTDGRDITATREGGCLTLRVTGRAPLVSVVAPARMSFLFVPAQTGNLKAYLSLLAQPQEADSVSVDVIGGHRYAIAIPDVGADGPWTLSLVPTVDRLGGQLCLARASAPFASP